MSQVSSVDATESIVEYDDGRSFDSSAVRKITQQWMDDHMKEREAEFTESRSLRVFCGTWNVNAKKQEGGLHDWLLPKDQETADVYAIGFQEMVDLNAMNVAIDSSKSQQRSQFWQGSIVECLQSSGLGFVMVAEKHLVGLLLVVYVRDSLVSCVKDVRTASTGVGLMGMLGNKGGVSVRMSLYDTAVCFVCAHLAAHRENVAGRNADFKNIMERTLLTSSEAAAVDAPTEDATSVVRPRYGAARYLDVDVTIPDHELILWVGDLNYRIIEGIETEDVFAMIDSKQLPKLRDLDQLNVERRKGAVFQGFEEGVIDFAPTYKFQPGTDLYERRAEKKLRAPAWCDRVLWRTQRPGSVRLLKYRSSTLRPSDHKPVSALLETDLRVVVARRELEVYNSLRNTLEFWRNSESPVADVTGYPVDLDNVKFNVKQTCTIQIKNKGKTYVHWHFISKLEDIKICKSWISLSKTSGLLFPEQVENVELVVLVDRETAQALNVGKESLQDILVLRIENFNDFYINVSGNFHRSSFGMLFEELVDTPGPVRLTTLPASGTISDVDSSASSDPAAQTTRLAIPKELWRLVDALYTTGALREKDIFMEGVNISADSDPLNVFAIREALDCGTEFPSPCLAHGLALVLVELVSSFARPLIPSELIPLAEIEPASVCNFTRRLLDSLPPLNYNIVLYLVSLFREVLAENEFNRTTAARLADLCVTSMTSNPNDRNLSEDLVNARSTRHAVLQPIFTYLLTTKSI